MGLVIVIVRDYGMLGFPDKFKVGVFIQDFPHLLKERKEAEEGREKSKYEVNTCLMTTSVPQTPHGVTAARVLSRWAAMALGRASPLGNWDKACLGENLPSAGQGPFQRTLKMD